MRRTPQQARSRDMVERIVVAARSVLADTGYDGFSTNRVADAAGISPGSLYQYFPNKAAILDLVVDRYWDDVSARVVASLGDRIGPPSAATIRDVADALVAALENDRVLLQVIDEELPHRGFRDRRRALEERIGDLLRVMMLASAPELGLDQSTSIAWTITQTMEGLSLRWVIDQPALPRDVFLDQVVNLIVGYLMVVSQGHAT